jgi:hypothetical protein
MPPIPFGVDSYQHASLPISARRMINAYLEPGPPAAKTAAAVVSAFGIKNYLTIGSGPMRGAEVVNKVLYLVSGSALYSVDLSNTVTLLGSIPGTGPVFIDGDGSNVMVTVNGPSYLWNGAAVNLITDPDFPGYEWVAFLDGYMVGGPGDGRVYVNHTPFDPSNWDALDFASAEAAPDDVVVGIVNHRELFLFGRQTTEVWYNSGDQAFPLTRTASGFMEIGTTSKYAPVSNDNTMFFPGHDGIFYRVNGYTPVRISTTAIEQAVAKFPPQEFRGMAWIENGHKMVGWTFNEGTFVYDISTQLWHERQSYGASNWRPQFIVRGNNQSLVGDRISNKLGVLDADTFKEWDEVMVASVTSPAIQHPEGVELLQHAYLELVFEQGVGVVTGQGSDPKVMVRFSDDDGRTFGNEIWRPLGKMGDFRSSTRINRLGSTYRDQGRVYRYEISDPVRRTLVQAFTDSAA